MKKLILYYIFLFLPSVSFAQWEKDIKILNQRVDIEGYLCRYIYRTSDSLFETCIFLPVDNINFDEKILCKMSKKNGSMLYRKPLDSYIFNQYMQSLNYYVITPSYGTLKIGESSDKSEKFFAQLAKNTVPDSVNFNKSQSLLFAETNGIAANQIKKGIFLVYFGRVKVCGTTLSIIQNADEYFNLNKNWETDIRRWYWGELTAKYTKSKDNRYIDIRFVY